MDIDIDMCILHLSNCLYPRILISLGSCVCVCILASLYPHILRSMYSRYLLVSSHSRVLISLGLYVLACNLLSSHPLILRFMYSVYSVYSVYLVSSNSYILISLISCTLGACWYPRTLRLIYSRSLGSCILEAYWYPRIFTSSYP